ncbi:MAG: hypothetical protein JWO98_2005 [Frankiales bacterium]|nr:hypothetical protein [Frankiales bacterium]
MLPRHGHIRDTAKCSVQVTDILAVQRILTMLTGRGYAVTHLEAGEVAGGKWRATLDLLLTANQVDLLAARLDRAPSVLDFDVRWGGGLAATA